MAMWMEDCVCNNKLLIITSISGQSRGNIQNCDTCFCVLICQCGILRLVTFGINHLAEEGGIMDRCKSILSDIHMYITYFIWCSY